MNDKRLIGKWKSDARRNRKEIRLRCDVVPDKANRERFAGIFGHLVIDYTGRTLTTDFHGHRTRHQYRVLAKDSESVVIESFDELLGQPRIRQLFFVGNYYWRSVGDGRLREWFRRIR